jgi:hypothetical protein
MTAIKTALIAVLLVLIPRFASGHEIGATQITAVFEQGRYVIDIAVDPDALLTRLQIQVDGTAPHGLTREARDRALARLGAAFVQSVSLAFDGRAVDPRFDYRPASSFSDFAQAPSTVRLSGEIPQGASVFTVSYGLAAGTFALIARVGESEGQTFWIEGGAPSPAIALAAPPASARWHVVRRYVVLGFTHILPKGFDHILFVLGLFLLNARRRSLLVQVSAFTLAHSITLGLTIYGVVSVPPKVVEPLIAASIAYVAIENMCTRELKSWRIALVFAFGLLHGMGFAGVLRDLGMPRGDFLAALVSFNIGVEAGQLTMIGLACLLLASWNQNAAVYRRRIVQPASLGIALVGGYWTVQRLF